jgi:glyoxylate/hydroxypyruvate reductase A
MAAYASLALVRRCVGGEALPAWASNLPNLAPGRGDRAVERGAPQAEYAVVWAPPQAFFDEQTQLKAVFNIGAGVDALLKLRLPPGALIVRLDDAGMSVQMAEYVCHAVIRHLDRKSVV